jgi:hypothetical protein
LPNCWSCSNRKALALLVTSRNHASTNKKSEVYQEKKE